MNLRIFAILFLFVTILAYLGVQQPWMGRMVAGDVIYYSFIGNYFKQHGNLTGILSVYQPLANIFFLLPMPVVSLLKDETQAYVSTFVVLNMILVLIFAGLYSHYTGSIKSAFVFIAVLALTGPIIFFRFELFTALLVVLGFYFWKVKKTFWASFFLGLGTAVKIYPFIFLPYFFILQRDKPLRYHLKILLGYFMGIGLVISVYLFALRGTPGSIVWGLNYHHDRGIHTESVWATVITLGNKLSTGSWPIGIHRYGNLEVDPQKIFIPSWLYNYFWIIPLCLFYLLLYRKGHRKSQKLDPLVPIAAGLILLVSSKVLSPQYLLWISTLMPLIDLERFTKLLIWVGLVVIIFLFTQYIFPLNYDKWTLEFYTNGQSSYLFWVNTLRNISLVALTLSLSRKALAN